VTEARSRNKGIRDVQGVEPIWMQKLQLTLVGIGSMQPGKPSETALRAAGLRAAHQILDHGAIFEDPLAMRILGTDPETIVRVAQSYPSSD
jgi:hypothetical protein